MRSLVMLFFAAATFLFGSVAVDAELARTGSFQPYLGMVWLVTVVPSIVFLIAAVVLHVAGRLHKGRGREFESAYCSFER